MKALFSERLKSDASSVRIQPVQSGIGQHSPVQPAANDAAIHSAARSSGRPSSPCGREDNRPEGPQTIRPFCFYRGRCTDLLTKRKGEIGADLFLKRLRAEPRHCTVISRMDVAEILL